MRNHLFEVPAEDEGVGAYVDEIYLSLKYWVDNNDIPLQDHEVLESIKVIVDTYFERDEANG